MKKVAGGASLIDPKAVARVVERIANPPKSHSALDALSPQERRLLDFIAEGLTNRQIAESMYLSEKTVKNYMTGLLNKLNMNNRTEAAVYATRMKSGSTSLGSRPAGAGRARRDQCRTRRVAFRVGVVPRAGG